MMTSKAFFEQVRSRLVEHLKRHRPEQAAALDSIVIGNFDQVLAIIASLMERDARIQDDLKRTDRQLRAMAEEFGLSVDSLPEDDGDPSGTPPILS